MRPASIIVANWREKIWSDFGLIFLKAVRTPSSPADELSVEHLGEEPADAELLACGRDVGRFELAVELESPAALIAVYA